jgi:Pretoxin HINT domain
MGTNHNDHSGLWNIVEHPFLVTDRGFVDAMKLVPGEHVQMLDGSVGTVVKTAVVPGVDVRYNLTVQDLHAFEVGQDQWVVHNAGPGACDYHRLDANETLSNGETTSQFVAHGDSQAFSIVEKLCR